jgi:hypothetical protein
MSEKINGKTVWMASSLSAILADGKKYFSGLDDIYAWFGGGETSVDVSTVDRITFSNDTATASVRGPLSLARR